MFPRQFQTPQRSFFLFGPRATGKSTWLRDKFPGAQYYDLLRSDVLHRFLKNPSALRDEVLALKSGWVVIDEVQRVPELLNEVHALIEETDIHFALTGSSARKLKHGNANLLAGRASVREFFPLTAAEIAHSATIDDLLRFGCLPLPLTQPDDRIDILRAYGGTYLQEEIKAEALTRKVDAFARFLEVAAIANAQVTNLANIARDAGIARATVSTYFDILEDTLIGVRLPAWQPRLRIKEVAHPKFYLFDTGVARVLQGRIYDRPAPEELGHLLETYVLHEIRAHLAYRNIAGKLAYWRTPQGVEVDFVWMRGKRTVAIEVKSSNRWKPEFEKGLRVLCDSWPVDAAFAIYRGDAILKREWGTVYPVEEFTKALTAGEIFPS